MNSINRLTVLAGLSFVIASIAPPTHRRVGVQSIGADVYAAILGDVDLQPLPDTLLLGDSTLRFEVPGGSTSGWQRQFDSMPPELPQKLETLSRTRKSSQTLSMPRPARVLTHVELASIFSVGPAGWTEFFRRYPRQRGYFKFSPVAFSNDSLDALVYYEYGCGGRCGGGHAAWVTRRGRSNHWQLRKKMTFWVS